jgi:hypothetical protein
MHLIVPTMMTRMMVVALPGQKIDFDTARGLRSLLFSDVVLILLPMISAN